MKKIIAVLVLLVAVIWGIPSGSTDQAHHKFTTDMHTIQRNKAPESQANTLSSNEGLSKESTGNSTNKELATEDENKIYYSDGSNLWSMNKDGTGKTKIQEEAYPFSIQVLGDTIYYINEETDYIYQVSKDGTENKQVSSDKAYSLNIYNGQMYFMDRYNKLYITAMSLDGKNKEVIKEVVANDMMVYGDYIYYITRDGTIGKVKTDGSSSQIIETDVMQFDVSKTGIYYTYDPRKDDRGEGLYRLDFNSDVAVQLLIHTPYSFNVHGDMVYYNHPTNLNLYSMTTNGHDKQKITGANTMQINVAGNYIFYKNLEDGKKAYKVKVDGTKRTSLEGKTQVTNVIDLSNEINELEDKEISPKLRRTYNRAKEITNEMIDANMNDYERAKAVHDYVVNNTRYDVEAADNFLNGQDSDANAFMAYGALINGKAVCQGYAEAVQILLSLAGIQSDLVIGDARGEDGTLIPHMWNRVLIDNEFYMLDATWDDPVGPVDVLLHDFFLVDSETLKKTHVWAYDEYPQ